MRRAYDTVFLAELEDTIIDCLTHSMRLVDALLEGHRFSFTLLQVGFERPCELAGARL
jgi:hypothetical protein